MKLPPHKIFPGVKISSQGVGITYHHKIMQLNTIKKTRHIIRLCSSNYYFVVTCRWDKGTIKQILCNYKTCHCDIHNKFFVVTLQNMSLGHVYESPN